MSRNIAVLCLGVLIAITSTVAAQSPSAPPPHKMLDSKLLKASAANATQGDVETAVEGIFSLSGVNPVLAQTLQVRSKIVAAELAYHRHQHSTTSEWTVAHSINNISRTWSLPPSTLTNPDEVRKLHVTMVSYFPKYLTSDLKDRVAVHKSTIVRTDMSPLETTLLFSMLVHQKLANPEYQRTNEEYRQVWKLRRAGKPVLPPQDRSTATYQAITAAGANSGIFASLNQANATLADLGIIGGAQ